MTKDSILSFLSILYHYAQYPLVYAQVTTLRLLHIPSSIKNIFILSSEKQGYFHEEDSFKIKVAKSDSDVQIFS